MMNRLMRYVFSPTLMLMMVLVLSACGGGDGDSGVPSVSLTVALTSTILGENVSGQKIQITASGGPDFTCFQADAQGVDVDSRCGKTGGVNGQGSVSIIFGSLPTGKTYTLSASDGGGGGTVTPCTVSIQNTTSLTAETPCAQNGSTNNSIIMTIP